MAPKEETKKTDAVNEQRKEKIQHNEEIYNKLKVTKPGLIGEMYVEGHHVPRCN